MEIHAVLVPLHTFKFARPAAVDCASLQLKLTASLKRAGIQAAFSDLADFSRMSETRLKISDVVHTVRMLVRAKLL